MERAIPKEESLILLTENKGLPAYTREMALSLLEKHYPGFRQTDFYREYKEKQILQVASDLSGSEKALLVLLPLIYPLFIALKYNRQNNMANPVIFLLFPISFMSYPAVRFRLDGARKKLRSYRIFMCCGLLLWTIIVVMMARFCLR